MQKHSINLANVEILIVNVHGKPDSVGTLHSDNTLLDNMKMC